MNAPLIAGIQYKNSATEYNMHYHHNHEIIYITNGKCEMQINDKKYHAKRNDLILICNLEKHSTRITEFPYERYVLMINPSEFNKQIPASCLNAVFKQRPSDFKHCLKSEGMEIKDLFTKLALEKNKPDDFSDEMSVMYLKEILITILRQHEAEFQYKNNKINEIIMEAQNYMENHFAEDIKIGAVAERFFISKYYFSHCFKEFSGISPKQYLTQVRLQNAVYLIEHSSLSVSEIAACCGFSDVNNFIRTFKAEFGLSVSKYRKSY